jgi:hypothetical protein
VHARGRRTRFTSLSTDPKSIVIFGPQLWRFKEALAAANSHRVLSHQALLTALRNELNSHDAKAQDLAARALRRARMRKEALVLWGFDVSRVDRKDLSEWARPHVQQYFSRV